MLGRARGLSSITLLVATLSCGARSGVLLGGDAEVATGGGAPVAGPCTSGPTQCVVRGDDPCGVTLLAAPSCDAATLIRSCPDSSWPYRRAADSAACLPLHGSEIVALSGSLTQVPTDDGRCLWVAEQVQTTSGATITNVAFEPDPRAPFGSCPLVTDFVGGKPTRSVRFADGSDDPSLQVQISSSYRANGVTRVAYRLFRFSANATFGVDELGTALGTWDPQTQSIVVNGPDQLQFQPDLDFGNATLAGADYSYLWGCGAPGRFFTKGCVLGRIDHANEVQLFLNSGVWGSDTRAADAKVVFDDGPWISSVTRYRDNAIDLLHVFAVDFADVLQAQRAPQPEGPWDDAKTIQPCDLPKGDSKAYCAGVIVHDELSDPTRPHEVAVSYGLGTTDATGTGSAEDYWSRLVWATVP